MQVFEANQCKKATLLPYQLFANMEKNVCFFAQKPHQWCPNLLYWERKKVNNWVSLWAPDTTNIGNHLRLEVLKVAFRH